jgi:4,5-dihydroxyphthalate decarboxylase
MTTAKPLQMTIAVSTYGHTQPLKEGRIPIDGVEPEFPKAEPIIGAYRRMVREVAFDACELAATTYMAARAYGAPFKALPIFMTRSFHHKGIVCREDSGIKIPKDLEGKKVGVRAYSVTTGVWTRGILASEYGLDVSKVTWVVDDEEHVTQLVLPPNVVHVPEGESLVSMMDSGRIQAGFTSNAGIGRQGPPKAGWDGGAAPAPDVYYDLLENTPALEAEWFKRTGIYPMHALLVVKDSLLAEHPWLARSLYEAFRRGKEEYVARLRAGEATTEKDRNYRRYMAFVGDDPLPYGIEANQASIAALIDYALDQKLIPRRLSIDELFIDPQA